jgi:NAD(P)-dependent dehydrogenase (short-subunit alcohol dehydrogenase family)
VTAPRLGGKVVVLMAEGEALAKKLVAEGATVVLTGPPAEDVGALLAELEGGPGRVAYFPAGDDADALVEFVAELFG